MRIVTTRLPRFSNANLAAWLAALMSREIDVRFRKNEFAFLRRGRGSVRRSNACGQSPKKEKHEKPPAAATRQAATRRETRDPMKRIDDLLQRYLGLASVTGRAADLHRRKIQKAVAATAATTAASDSHTHQSHP